MTVLQKLHIGLTGALLLALLGCIGYTVARQNSYEGQIVDLRNQAATKDQTIELKQGLYTKLSLQLKDATDALDSKDKQQKDLLDQLKKSKQDLLAVTTANIGLKDQLAKLAGGIQTEVPAADGKSARTKIDFHQDFGFVTVDGWTLTNPPQSWLRLNPGKPLTLSVAVSQSSDKAWHSYVTTDNPDFAVDIKVAAVNPYVLQPKWYEGIGTSFGLGMGNNQSGLGALVAVGLNYKIKQFTVGPSVWLGINNVVDKYYGVSFEWRPFEKVDR